MIIKEKPVKEIHYHRMKLRCGNKRKYKAQHSSTSQIIPTVFVILSMDMQSWNFEQDARGWRPA
jgi:hypothetical protein